LVENWTSKIYCCKNKIGNIYWLKIEHRLVVKISVEK
jgi:hypothetical protein